MRPYPDQTYKARRLNIRMEAILLTPKEAARYLNICLSDLALSRTTGKIGDFDSPPFIRLGRRVRYRKFVLDHWVKNLPSYQKMAEE